jgi:hypothetical protein
MQAKFILNEVEEEWVSSLCREFDPEQFVAPGIRERGEEADWQAYRRIERSELREHLEIATLVGKVLENLSKPWWADLFEGVEELVRDDPGYKWAGDADLRLAIFYQIAQELTSGKRSPEDRDDYEAGARLSHAFTKEESDHLSAAMHETCEAACRRALSSTQTPKRSPTRADSLRRRSRPW